MITEYQPGRWVVTDDTGKVQAFDCNVDGQPKTVREWPTMRAAEDAALQNAINLWFLALVDWLQGAGVCHGCAVQMSMAKVEKFHGRKYDWKQQRGPCMGAPCSAIPFKPACWRCAQGMHCETRTDCVWLAGQARDKAPGAPGTADKAQEQAA